MKIYEIATREFKNKSGVTRYFTEMLYDYSLRTRLNPRHEAEVYCLLDYHPDIAEKTHMDIDRIEIWSNRYGRRSFRLIYVDGSNDDFSIRTCVTNMTPTKVPDDQLVAA